MFDFTEKEDRKMAAISNDWLAPLTPEFAKPYYRELYKKVKDEATDWMQVIAKAEEDGKIRSKKMYRSEEHTSELQSLV